MIIVAPTRFGTLAHHVVYQDGDRIFLGGGVLANVYIDYISLLWGVENAYGHLGPGVVVEVGCTGRRAEVGVILLDESRTLEDVRSFFARQISEDCLR